MAIKVTEKRNGKGDIFYVAVTPGADGFYEQYSELTSNLELCESSALASQILSEGIERADRRAAAIEEARRRTSAVVRTGAGPAAAAAAAKTKLEATKIEEAAKMRRRVGKAFRLLGIPEEPTKDEADVLAECWLKLCGGNEEAAAIAQCGNMH